MTAMPKPIPRFSTLAEREAAIDRLARTATKKARKVTRPKAAEVDPEGQPYHLLWHYRGKLRGMRFPTWEVCEKYSKALIAHGLTPRLTSDSPCPYDGAAK